MAIGTAAQMARASRIAQASSGKSVNVAYGTSAQMARGARIGAKAMGKTMTMGTVQAMVTSPMIHRVSLTDTNRRQAQSSRRLAGMPAYMTLPKRAMTYSGPAMIADTAQSGK